MRHPGNFFEYIKLRWPSVPSVDPCTPHKLIRGDTSSSGFFPSPEYIFPFDPGPVPVTLRELLRDGYEEQSDPSPLYGVVSEGFYSRIKLCPLYLRLYESVVKFAPPARQSNVLFIKYSSVKIGLLWNWFIKFLKGKDCFEVFFYVCKNWDCVIFSGGSLNGDCFEENY